MVIGSNPADSYNYGNRALHVTLHHNWLGPLMKNRPLLRGFVHLYNNYFDNSSAPDGKTAAGFPTRQINELQIGSGGVVYSEFNHFYKTRQTNQIGLDRAGDNYAFYERSNVYDQTTGASATGSAFSASPVAYSYKTDASADVAHIVEQSSGPR